MRNQSNLRLTHSNLAGKPAPIHVNPDFPVAEPDYNTRSDRVTVPPHIHDMFEIGYCISGTGIFLAADKIMTFRAGDAVVVNTREVHLAKGYPGSSTSWGFLNFDPLHLLSKNIDRFSPCLDLSRFCGSGFRNIIDGEENPELAMCIRQIVDECRDKRPDWHSMVRALVWRMVLLLGRYYSEDEPERDAPGDYAAFERIAPAMNWMNAHFTEEVNVERLAKLCCTSVPNFRKLFHSAMGMSPKPYLLKMRLNTACSMLQNTKESILEIAYRCGYGNISNFNRQFRMEFKMSPRDFRNEKAPAE